MTQSQPEGQQGASLKRRIGKIGLAIGLLLIFSVIILGLLTSLVSAYDGSTELVHVYDAIVVPGLVFGFLFLVSGVVTILVPEGMSHDGTWSLQTGPFR